MPAPSSRPQNARKPHLPRLSKKSIDRVHLLDSTAGEAETLALARLLEHVSPQSITVIGETYGDIQTVAAEYAVKIGYVGLKDLQQTEGVLVMTKSLHALEDEGALIALLTATLKPGSLAVLEVAHPRTGSKGRKDGHKNYRPRVLSRQLAAQGFKVERTLSVATLHNSGLTKLMPDRVLLAVEGLLHPTPAARLFGPSVYFLIRRLDA